MVDHHLPGQVGHNERPRQEIGPGPCDLLRVLVAEPEDLRRDVGGVDVEAGDPEGVLRVHFPAQALRLTRGAPVHPDDAGAKRAQRLVDGHRTIHLGGEADCGHGAPVNPTSLKELADHLTKGRRPLERILLRPACARIRDRISLGRLGDDARVAVHQDTLETLGANVAADDVDSPVLKSHQS